MYEILKHKLYKYTCENNPDILALLQSDKELTDYWQNKLDSNDSLLNNLIDRKTPTYNIEEECLSSMSVDLRPSKYNYIEQLIEEEFETAYRYFEQDENLTYEIINIINLAVPVFETFSFNEGNENDRSLRYEVISMIREYLEINSEKEL